MNRVFRFIWEFPQNLVGCVVKKITKATLITECKDATIYHWKINGGLSLGKYIFVPFTKMRPNSRSQMYYIRHEYGHTIQSKYLGWLYLPVIALPSLIWAGFFGWYREDNGIDYYDFYTEKWANKLGEKVKFKWLGEYEDKEELITNGEE